MGFDDIRAVAQFAWSISIPQITSSKEEAAMFGYGIIGTILIILIGVACEEGVTGQPSYEEETNRCAHRRKFLGMHSLSL
jgi:hypothetical protein